MDVVENSEEWAIDDPTFGALEATTFPDEEYPDPPNDPSRDIVGLYKE